MIPLRAVLIFNKIPVFPYQGAGSNFLEIIKKNAPGNSDLHSAAGEKPIDKN